jgi:ADP-ribose pyrophosphatase YjhB (NUDIX family)
MTQYCLNCGSPTNLKIIENRVRAVCGECGWIYYEHRKVSAGARVVSDGKLLLVQRGIEPWKGCWHLPSGYMEVDEEPQRAAEREVMEETGLIVKADHLVDVYTYDDDPRGNGIVLVYDAQRIDGNFIANNETTGADFFSADEIMTLPLAGMAAERSIQDWIISRSKEGEDR